MKAIRVHELGGPDVLKYEDIRAPTPGPGQALVRVEAIGLNFIDCFFDDGPIYVPTIKRGSRGIAQAERSSSLAATSPACAPRPTLCFLAGVVLLYALLVLAGCYATTRRVGQQVPGEVLMRAEAEGSVRVVVELNVGPQGIRAAQDELLHELEGTRHRVTRRYEQIPFLALEVSPEALQVLDTSSTVLRIQEDRLLLPQEGKSP